MSACRGHCVFFAHLGAFLECFSAAILAPRLNGALHFIGIGGDSERSLQFRVLLRPVYVRPRSRFFQLRAAKSLSKTPYFRQQRQETKDKEGQHASHCRRGQRLFGLHVWPPSMRNAELQNRQKKKTNDDQDSRDDLQIRRSRRESPFYFHLMLFGRARGFLHGYASLRH